MKNYTITEEQIKKLSTQDQIVEEYLNKWFPEVFKKELEIGKWYKNVHLPTTIINCQVFEENTKTGYGVHEGLWSENWGLLNFEDYIEATDVEVEQALIKEAKKRGYTTENTIGVHYYGYTWTREKVNSNFKFHFYGNNLWSMPEGEGGKLLFSDGIWAELLNKKVTLNFHQIAEKFGIDVNQLRITKM